jgi:SPP1 gp7 family putative phage head morphogenesis protein
MQLHDKLKILANTFCATGKGGGVDPSCSQDKHNNKGTQYKIQLGYLSGDGSVTNVPNQNVVDKITSAHNKALNILTEFGVDTAGIDNLQIVEVDDPERGGAYARGSAVIFAHNLENQKKFASVFKESKSSAKEKSVPLFAFKNTTDVILHELGHNIGRRLSVSAHKTLETLYEKYSNNVDHLPSFYAQENSSEMFAESVLAIVRGYKFGGVGLGYGKQNTEIEQFVKKQLQPLAKKVHNAFCPTGKGGGQDNSCSGKNTIGIEQEIETLKSEFLDKQFTPNLSAKPDPDDVIVAHVTFAKNVSGILNEGLSPGNSKGVGGEEGGSDRVWFWSDQTKMVVKGLHSKSDRVVLLAVNPKDIERFEGTHASRIRQKGKSIPKEKVLGVFSPKTTHNAFCPTGPGGGQDNSCSPNSSAQIDTPAFKKWFGDSKVVDDSGKPLVVYHGTTGDFNTFDPNLSLAGIHFTDSPRIANIYSEQVGGNVKPAYLKIENPADGNKLLTREAQSLGHDGVIKQLDSGEKVYIVFDSNQIKSATGNKGTFNPKDPIITHSANTQVCSADCHVHNSNGRVHNAKAKQPRRTFNKKPVQRKLSNKKSPTRIDPTRLATLRRVWTTDLKRRFKSIDKALYQLLVVDDAFGINGNKVFNVFCATGEGGGVDPSCSPNDSGGKLEHYEQTMQGEFWLQGSTAISADGDVDDMNHEGHAIQQAQYDVANAFGIEHEEDWDKTKEEIHGKLIEDRPELQKSLDWIDQYGAPSNPEQEAVVKPFYDHLKEVGLTPEDWEVANGNGNQDSRIWAADKHDWVRVAGNSIQTVGIDSLKMSEIADGLWDAYGDDVEQQSFDVEVIAKDSVGKGKNIYTKLYRDVPYHTIAGSSVNALRDYVTNATENYDVEKEVERAAKETDRNPSEAQRKAGTYRKGKVWVQGLEVAIESPRGSTRSGIGADGKPWSTTMQHHYGYIKLTESEADGDHIDCFLGPNPSSDKVFIVDQTKGPDFKEFDEHKTLIGWDNVEEAKQAYHDNFSEGWQGFSDITEMTMQEFKQWLKEGDSSKPVANAFCPTGRGNGQDNSCSPSGLPFNPAEAEKTAGRWKDLSKGEVVYLSKAITGKPERYYLKVKVSKTSEGEIEGIIQQPYVLDKYHKFDKGEMVRFFGNEVVHVESRTEAPKVKEYKAEKSEIPKDSHTGMWLSAWVMGQTNQVTPAVAKALSKYTSDKPVTLYRGINTTSPNLGPTKMPTSWSLSKKSAASFGRGTHMHPNPTEGRLLSQEFKPSEILVDLNHPQVKAYLHELEYEGEKEVIVKPKVSFKSSKVTKLTVNQLTATSNQKMERITKSHWSNYALNQKLLQLAKQGGTLVVNSSYFAECERDEKGHCLPSGEVGDKSNSEESKTPESSKEESSAGKFDRAKWQGRREEWGKLPVGQRDNLADAENSVKSRVSELLKGVPERPNTGDLSKDLETRIGQLSDRVHPQAADRMKTVVRDYTNLMNEAGVKPEHQHALAMEAVDHLAAQESETMSRQLGDHGVAHIKGDIDVAMQTLNALPTKSTAQDKLAAYTACIYHDTGYLTEPSRSFLDEGHPRWSEQYYNTNIKPTVAKALGDRAANEVSHIIRTHDATDMDWNSDSVASSVRLADNLAVFHREKLPPVFRYVNGNIDVLKDLGAGKIDKATANERMVANIDKSNLTDKVKSQLRLGAKEVSEYTPKVTLGMLGGTLTGIKYKEGTVVAEVKESKKATEINKLGDFGQNQLAKLAKTFDADPKQFQKDLNFTFKGKDGRTRLRIEMQKAVENILLNAGERFHFQTSPEQVNSFRQWIAKILKQYVLDEEVSAEDQWFQQYVEEGYRRGASRAFDDTRPAVKKWLQSEEANKKLDFYDGTRADFLRSSFARPVSVEKVKLLAGRSFTDLKGISDQMSAKLTRGLTDGLVQGKNSKQIYKDLAKDVGISESRARAIAQTELTRAHASGQIQSFKDLGVTKLGVMAEIATAQDDRVCEACNDLNGVVLTVDEAEGILPVHTSCRCALIPANVGEDEEDQVRSKLGIEKAIDAATEVLGGSDKTTWPGADVSISKTRPQGIFNSREVLFNQQQEIIIERLDQLIDLANNALSLKEDDSVVNNTEPVVVESTVLSNKIVDLVNDSGTTVDNRSFFAECDRDEKGRCLPGDPVDGLKKEHPEFAEHKFNYVPSLGETIARYEPNGTITVTDTFFGHGKEDQRQILAHEVGHGQVASLTTPEHAEEYWKLVDSDVLGKYDEEKQRFVGLHGQRNADEVLADLAADYYLDPDKLKERYPVQYPIIKKILTENRSFFAECQRDEHGRCLPEGSSGSKSQLATRTYKPSTAEKQRKGEAEQLLLAKAIKGVNTDDNQPFDIIKGKNGIEVKTLMDNNNDKITVHPESRIRKEKEAKKLNLDMHTVAIDTRAGRKVYYYKAGVGAFRISSMQRVSLSQLKEMLS